jgi:septation ring formation regulator EzrA
MKTAKQISITRKDFMLLTSVLDSRINRNEETLKHYLYDLSQEDLNEVREEQKAIDKIYKKLWNNFVNESGDFK